jgi:hypothetical protein
MDFDAVTLRDVVLAVIGLVGVYLVVMVLRLTRLRRRPGRPIEEPAIAPIAPTIADEAEDEAEENLVYAPPPRAAAPQPSPMDFGAELTRSQQDSEIRQLREEVLQLREQVGQLRAELAGVNAARLVSPQYSDAMAFAQRGLSAQDVADRCNISLGEAELVWALSRGPKNFDQEEEYGGEPGVEQPRAA